MNDSLKKPLKLSLADRIPNYAEMTDEEVKQAQELRRSREPMIQAMVDEEMRKSIERTRGK